jgi:hypothetical protein
MREEWASEPERLTSAREELNTKKIKTVGTNLDTTAAEFDESWQQ